MTMTTENNANRTGIYVQESAGATTAGDGLDPQGDKSPVTELTYDNTSNTNHSNETQNQEEKQNLPSNPFKRSASQLSSIVAEGGSESDASDRRSKRNCKFRMKRNQQMRKEFLKLGFSKQEIRAMQTALDEERKERHNQNKMLRFCKETKMDPVSIKQTWLERKEQELAKFRAEKAAKIAAGTFDPLPFRERKRKREKERQRQRQKATEMEMYKARKPERMRDRGDNVEKNTGRHNDKQISSQRSFDYSSSESKTPKSIQHNEPIMNLEEKVLFVSPAIRAGAQKYDYSRSLQGRIEAIRLMNRMAFSRVKNFGEARRRMGLSGRHKGNRNLGSMLRTKIPPYILEKKKIHNVNLAVKAEFPIEVYIFDRSHPFGEIAKENHFLMLDALETTIADENAIGASSIGIAPGGQYSDNQLHLYCKNIDTMKFLEYKIPLYNRLWRNANLFVTTEEDFYPRYKYTVTIKNYNLTPDEFFKIIKKQNGYATEFWIFHHRNRVEKYPDDFKALFYVDSESHRRLQESNGFVYFFFERIEIRLDVMKTKKGNALD